MPTRDGTTPCPAAPPAAIPTRTTTKTTRLGLAFATAAATLIAVGEPARADQFGPSPEDTPSSAQTEHDTRSVPPSRSERRVTPAHADDAGSLLPWLDAPPLPQSTPQPQSAASGTTGFVHPGVVYTKADIRRWSTSSAQYRRLASSWAGNVDSKSAQFVPVRYGVRIDHGPGGRKDPSSEMNAGLKDQSGFAKVQAVLWAADRKPKRRAKVVAYLREFRSVKAIAEDDSQQYRLVAGWSCTNLAQAAEIVGYRDAEFRRFLTNVCYPILDWTNGGNWHASFADSKLAIAAYAGDRTLWRDAKHYFYKRIAQSIYHSAFDRGKVRPLHKEDIARVDSGDQSKQTLTSGGTPHPGFTVGHWGGWGAYPQISENLVAKYSGRRFPDGTNAERRRDLAHVNMALGAWTHAARTIRAQGEKLQPHAYYRLRAGFRYHSARVLAYAKTGRIPSPAPVEGDGGGARFQAYYGARAFFGARTPLSVRQMLRRPEVRGFPASGANHMVAEAFADGT